MDQSGIVQGVMVEDQEVVGLGVGGYGGGGVGGWGQRVIMA